MRRVFGCVVATLLIFPAGIPSALAVGVFASGSKSVNPDLGACAEVTFQTPQAAFVGELSVVGYSVEPTTASMAEPSLGGVFVDAVPVVRTSDDYWYGCVSGAGRPVNYGAATYTFEVSGPSGDFLQCEVVAGARSCRGL